MPFAVKSYLLKKIFLLKKTKTMPSIHLTTTINAPIQRVFDLARSIDFHKISTGNSREEAIAGTTSGLIEAGEYVTWCATHFGIRQNLSSKITAMTGPLHFRDEMVKGTFKKLVHDHEFSRQGSATIMTDRFYFEAPYGILGKLANTLFLTNYLTTLLQERNSLLKEYAESEMYRTVLPLSSQ
jgi:ligand-binding SRPBCC domain-containing protein